MKRHNRLNRRIERLSDRGLFGRFFRILGVVAYPHDVPSGAHGIHHVGEAGRQGNDPVDGVGHNNLAPQFIVQGPLREAVTHEQEQ